MATGDAVQQIKDRLNILDVVSAYVELKQAGRHFKGRCPFHNEKSPSFHVSPDRGTYHCFGCGVGGDIFSFVQAIDGVDFKEALKTLAQRANVELVPEAPERRTEREKLVAILEATTAFYGAELENNTEAKAYLDKRGVSKETIKKWRIGYAPGPPTGGWRELKSHLNDIGYSDELLFKAGLIKGADTGKEAFDVFRDRIMFPLRDVGGKIVAFSGRILHPDDKAPKYVNSPETELFHKSELLYGYDFAKHHLRQLPFWLLVEGQFDVVMSHQAGYTTALAVSGTAFTNQHAQLLERLSKNVVLGLDTDKAGIAAMKKAADLMLRRGMDVKVARFADGADPADMVVSDLAGFKQAIGHSVHIIEFLLSHLRTATTDERSYKLLVREEVIPFVTLIPNRIDQEHFESIIASALNTTKDAIHFEVERLREQKTAPAGKVIERAESRQTPAPSIATIDLLQKTEAYLIAAVAVLSPGEGQVIKGVLETVTQEDFAVIKERVGSDLASSLTFMIEREFENLGEKTRTSELAYKCNLYRKLWYKDRLTKAKDKLATSDGADHDTVMTQITEATLKLGQAPYTDELFKG